ncbi:MAG TPA: 4-hydroxythreonine-4-phosphate dehydrogenase PdxA [Candidatus Saccharimonadia bacterium]|nr:4-hydroxythreonine-4-phosphate dehydrogenase PdxA [Candidatus Saccharimonadia bacterium]
MVPRIAITTGEPAGIGPELVAKLAQRGYDAELVALGDARLLDRAARQLGLPLRLAQFSMHTATPHTPGSLCCVDVPLLAPVTPGRLDSRNGGYVVDMLARASDGALDGTYDAIVTAPVHKGVVNDAGIAFTGHTEFFANRAGAEAAMMLAAPQLRVVLATTHLPLADVPAAITREKLMRTIRVAIVELRERFGIAQPRIAVLGLNPHAGEGGHLGREEIDTIAPVCDLLRAEGHLVEGPLSADTAFVAQRLARTDAFVAMYHDQGLPVLKALGFGDAVNVTLGLPYVRTSVDHGVALDVAGSGRGDASSLLAATMLAIELARSRRAVRLASAPR